MSEIARSSGVPYPTAYRMVQTLMHEGLIECEPARRRYRPTALVQTLAHGFQGDGRLVQAARPHIVELTKTLGWPITLSTHVGHSMVIRDSTHSISALTLNAYYPGYASPILETATGLAIISQMQPEVRQNLISGLKQLPNKHWEHIIARVENEAYLATIREQGYATRAFNLFTRNPGKTSSIAVAILEDGQPIGGISLAYFASSMSPEAAISAFTTPLMDAALQISRDLSAPVTSTPKRQRPA